MPVSTERRRQTAPLPVAALAGRLTPGYRAGGLGDDLVRRGGHVSTFLKPLLSLRACWCGAVHTAPTPALSYLPRAGASREPESRSGNAASRQPAIGADAAGGPGRASGPRLPVTELHGTH